MIVCMHSPLPSDEGNGVFLSSLSYLTASGIGFFYGLRGIAVAAEVRNRYFLEETLPEDCCAYSHLDAVLFGL